MAQIAFALFALAVLVVMYFLNRHTTLIADDYSYAYGLHGRIQGFADVLDNQYHHYFAWGGRSVVHTLGQMFLFWGKPVFNVLNALAYVWLVLAVYLHAVGWFKAYPLLLLTINLFLLLFTPAFGQDFLWLIGASNYLWGPMLAITFLLLYRWQYGREEPIFRNPLLCVLVAAFGVIAGWTNENMGVTVVVMAAAFMALYWKTHQRVYLWTVCGLAGAVIGAALLILAPGNFARLQLEGGGLQVHFFKNLFEITRHLFKENYLLVPLVTTAVLALLVPARKTDWKLPAVYLLGLAAAFYSMAAAPYFEGRAKIGPLLFAAMACGGLYTQLDFSNLKLRRVLSVLAVAMIAITISQYSVAWKDIRTYEKRDRAKIELALSEKAKGVKDIVIPRNEPGTRYCAAWGVGEIKPNPKHDTNMNLAKYFGLSSVRVEKIPGEEE